MANKKEITKNAKSAVAQNTSVKKSTNSIDNMNTEEIVERSWGGYKTIRETKIGDSYRKTKYLYIEGGKATHYQYHKNRDEEWKVVSGSIRVVIDGVEKYYNENSDETIFVPRMVKHLIQGITDAIVQEVQISESPNIEDDIVYVKDGV